MNKNYANKSVAIYLDNKYYIAIPTDGSENNNTLIEFNTMNNSFMTYDIDNINSGYLFNSLSHFSSSSVHCLLYGKLSLKPHPCPPMG